MMTPAREQNDSDILNEVDAIFKLLQKNNVHAFVSSSYAQTFEHYNISQLYIANFKVYWMADSAHDYEICGIVRELSVREQILDKFYLYKTVTTNVAFNI